MPEKKYLPGMNSKIDATSLLCLENNCNLTVGEQCVFRTDQQNGRLEIKETFVFFFSLILYMA